MYVRMVFSEPQNIFFTKPGMVMQHHKPQCFAEKLVRVFNRNVSEGLYNQNITISIISSKWLVCWQPNLHKPECCVEKWDYCIQGQGHSKGQNVSECLSRWYLLNHGTFFTKLGMVSHHHESTLCADSYSVSVPPSCYRSRMLKTLVILPKVQVAGYT